MNATLNPKEQRSGIANENIQEILDAEDSGKWATLQGANQYCTPEHVAQRAFNILPDLPESVLDPQAGKGALIECGTWRTMKFAIELDNRIVLPNATAICGNCVKVAEALEDIAPGTMFHCINANPPFAKRWTVNGKVIDSTEWTWNFVTRHGCFGFFISNHKTIERLGYDKHPFTYKYEVMEHVWPNCDVVIGIVWWHHVEAKPTHNAELADTWRKVGEIINEERGPVPEHNISLDHKGKLKTYLSTRSQVKKKLERDEILRLHRVNGQHPITLTPDRETRKLLAHLLECGFYTISAPAKATIEEALNQASMASCPIMKPTDFTLVAYADEEDVLECVASNQLGFTPGRKYELTTATYKFTDQFTRNKSHVHEETGEIYNVVHECSRTGVDRYIQIENDNGQVHRFMDKPDPDLGYFQHDETLLWQIFKRPVVKTIAEQFPDSIAVNNRILKCFEQLGRFTYYPGQVQYLARIAAKDYAYIAAATGVGKTLFAITMITLKGADRALIIAPQGTMRSSEFEDDEEGVDYQASQWMTELRTFAPFLQPFELFSLEDYYRILDANDGQLPNGVYVTYYEAFFRNKSRETCPVDWTDAKFKLYLKNKFDIDMPEHPDNPKTGWVETIGKERDGIRCICEPCLSTLVGSQFDMVLLDESHLASHAETCVTQMLIRLQPKYRYALSATPIPNIISNIFCLMGWLCVPDWYRGDRRNAAWPYARNELHHFESTFLSFEFDHTEEDIRKAKNYKYKGRAKPSPVISSPARLLKILKPTMGYISKEDCNPNLVPRKIVDVRVPFGHEQAILYAWFLDRGHIPCDHPLIRARKQIAWLRGICTDPAGFEHGGPKVHSNYNPKVIAILELIRQIMERGEQVVIVNARLGITNTLHWKLREAKVRLARIDSTVPPDMHAYQANLFKARRADVLLMGMKCAMGYSFPACPNLIKGSLEYSFGSSDQSDGRVWRVNSQQPVTIYNVLHKCSIEEIIHDVVCTKGDAATICLMGQRLAREYKPIDADEILADAITKFSVGNQPTELELESQWPKLREQIMAVKLTSSAP